MLLLAEGTERGEQVLDSKAHPCADKEMAIGRYYFGKQDWLAAMNRFKTVIAQCPGSSDAGEASAHLNEIFLRLGLTSEAK
jgi:outer membrane protein assembly factor BamD